MCKVATQEPARSAEAKRSLKQPGAERSIGCTPKTNIGENAIL
jgi:hypothetical protein